MTIKDGQNWCSDFGQYLISAQNIIEHKDYADTYYVGRSVVTPPGYPLILVPLLKFLGLNLIILKLPNIIFLLAFILLSYSMMRRRLGEEDALLGAMLLFTSPDFFLFKQYIMTDIPFMFFITASIFCWMKYEEAEKNKDPKTQMAALIMATFFMCYAFFVRWAGIALFLSTIIYFSYKKPDMKVIVSVLVGFVISILLQKSLGTNGLNYYYEVARPVKNWIMMSYGAMFETIKTIAVYFFPCKTKFTILVFSALGKSIVPVTLLFFTTTACMFVYRIYKKSLTLIECFFAIYLLGCLIWYYPGGTRYIYPVIGFLIIFFIQSLTFLRKFIPLNLTRIIIIFMIFHNSISLSLLFAYNDDQILKKDAREMVEWIKTHTRQEELLVFGKPRELGFLTKRHITSYFFLREGNICERIRQLNIHYIVLEDYREKYMLQRLNLTDLPFEALATNGVRIPTNIETGQFSLEEMNSCHLNLALAWGDDKEYKVYQVSGPHISSMPSEPSTQ